MTESMSEEWGKWLELEKTNIQTLESRIDNLASGHENTEDFRYREFWSEANEITELFKTLSPLPQDDKERLQYKYDRICRDAKKRQEQEWQDRRAQSRQKRTEIESKIREAYSLADLDPEDVATLSKAQSILKDALVLLKGNGKAAEPADESTAVPSDNGGFLRDDRQACWDQWREANDTIFGRRQSIWDRNYEEVLPETQAALAEANEGDPFQALEKIKDTQNKLKSKPLNKSQRDEIRNTLNSAWETAINKVNTVREEKRRKHEEWQGRMESLVERWGELIRQNKETASDLDSQIKNLSGEVRNAMSREHADTLRSLIAEKRQRVKEINGENADLAERISSVKEKLSG